MAFPLIGCCISKQMVKARRQQFEYNWAEAVKKIAKILLEVNSSVFLTKDWKWFLGQQGRWVELREAKDWQPPGGGKIQSNKNEKSPTNKSGKSPSNKSPGSYSPMKLGSSPRRKSALKVRSEQSPSRSKGYVLDKNEIKVRFE